MLESAEVGHRIPKERYEREEPPLRSALLNAQYDLFDRQRGPLLIIISGVGGGGRSETAKQLTEWMDPRHIQVSAFGQPAPEERVRPLQWRYWRAMPPTGRIGIFMDAWYGDVLMNRIAGKLKTAEMEVALQEIRPFEEMLSREGVVLRKFWIHLSREAQKARLEALAADPRTRWRVTAADKAYERELARYQGDGCRSARPSNCGDSRRAKRPPSNVSRSRRTIGATASSGRPMKGRWPTWSTAPAPSSRPGHWSRPKTSAGEPNRKPRAYHSGDHEEIGALIQAVRERVPHAPLYAVGVSLGGSALVNWLGRAGSDANRVLEAAAAVSTPLDLTAAGVAIGQGFNRVYTRHFLQTLKPKSLAVARRFPGLLDEARLGRVRSMYEFDDLVTAPLHGFTGTADYWRRAGSQPWLHDVAVPTLVLNARNDPFVPGASLPTVAEVSRHVVLEQPPTGGHAGFVTGPFPGRLGWLPTRLLQFFRGT